MPNHTEAQQRDYAMRANFDNAQRRRQEEERERIRRVTQMREYARVNRRFYEASQELERAQIDRA